jgi:glycosyltransferase involved in cell wall biosynthesis
MLVEDDTEHLGWAAQYCASVRTIKVGRYGKLIAPAGVLAAHLFGRPLRQRRAMAKEIGEAWPHWDVIHVEGSYAGGIVPDLPIAKVLSLHDSWTLRCAEMVKCAQSRGERLYYQLLRLHEPRYERLVLPRYGRCTVVAQPDLDEVRRVVPAASVQLIPYGTDTEYFRSVEVTKEPHTLVFHSHLGYAPNVEAAFELADNILPLVQREVPDATLHLVGANPGARILELARRPGIRVSANLPDLRPAVCAGELYACPIRHGTGLKSKMLEAMAMRLPIVGYPGAIVGLAGSVPGKHYLVAQDPPEFAAHVIALLRNPERAGMMARAGRELVEDQYSWESRARAYEDLYEEVIAERVRASLNNGLPAGRSGPRRVPA